jgi:2-(1,2-epoxy-1,2-dihydrophenyl)acetyl-CoA isomerase
MRRCKLTFSLIGRRTTTAGWQVTSFDVTDELLIDRADGVATVTLNRPESMNSLSVTLKEALATELDAIARDKSVRAVVLTGTGRGFCVGQDLHEHVRLLESGDPAPLRTVVEHYNPMLTTLATMPKPVIAAVNGMAAGAGAGLAFACDFRFASSKAGFLIAFANVGLTLDSGVSWTLPRLVGGARATALCLLAEPITAEAALEMGLVNGVFEPGHLMPAVRELAHRLANGPTAAYAAIRESLAYAATATLPQALAKEAELQNAMGATDDHRNATAAFVAKQQPVFTGQ